MSLIDIRSYIQNLPKNYPSREKSSDFVKLLEKEMLLAIKDNNQGYLDDLNLARCIIKGQDHFVDAFMLAKNGRFYEAWCRLEDSFETLKYYRQINIFSPDLYYVKWIRSEVKKIQNLFPYKVFCSPEFITKQQCNICGTIISPRKQCGHLEGKIYDRKLCEYEVIDIEFLALALVEKPVQKYSVPFAIDKKTGRSYDHYDYSLVKYLFDVLESPFDRWSYEDKVRKITRREFGKFFPNRKCVCNSGKKFKYCCSNKDIIEIPHVEFVFDRKLVKGKKIPHNILSFNKETRNIDNKFEVAFMRTS